MLLASALDTYVTILASLGVVALVAALVAVSGLRPRRARPRVWAAREDAGNPADRQPGPPGPPL